MGEMQQLACLGGRKTVTAEQGDMFTWPIITGEDEAAALDVLRRGAVISPMIRTGIRPNMPEDCWRGIRLSRVSPSMTKV